MLENDKSRDPIFIIGAARSGTTMLGDILSMHPEVAYWLEPKYIWRYRKALAPHDQREASEATSQVSGYIRKKFERFLKNSGKQQFIEKTPSNVFRIDFIWAIFPNAKFIHIVRDGRNVCLSAEKKWTSRPDKSALLRRLTKFEIPISDFPFYVLDVFRDVLGRTAMPDKGFIWGPWFKGIREYRAEHTVLETCAMQWKESMEAVKKAFSRIPEKHILTLRYETLLEEPEKQLEKVLSFSGLDTRVIDKQSELLKQFIVRKFTEKEKKKIESILPIIEKPLKDWGYKI